MIACYVCASTTYTVLVNGRTGEVAGERPSSAARITMAILIAVAFITAAVLLFVYL